MIGSNFHLLYYAPQVNCDLPFTSCHIDIISGIFEQTEGKLYEV